MVRVRVNPAGELLPVLGHRKVRFAYDTRSCFHVCGVRIANYLGRRRLGRTLWHNEQKYSELYHTENSAMNGNRVPALETSHAT